MNSQPKPFIRNYDGLLMELQSDPPKEKRPEKDEILDLEIQKGFPIRIVKYKNKFYTYRIR